MGELRLDPLTGEWTIVAPRRGQRPGAATLGPPARPAGEAAPALDPNFRTGAQAGSASVRAQGQGGVEPGCPFCPGHEFMAPPAVREIPGPGGWQVRIVPNKYPAVSPGQDDGNLRRADGDGLSPHDGKAAGASSAEEPPMVSGGADSLFQRLPARGHHEVVVETPEHHQHPADMEPCRWAAVLAAWRDRCRELGQTPQSRFLALFRNHGRVAGASQPHPHSQLIALDHVPPPQRRRWERQDAYYAATGRCLLCDVLDAEQTAGQRLVFADPHFIAFCPFAPVFPYEVWIAPRRHAPLFHHLSDGELLPLARVLVRVWGALRALGDPPHNLVVHSGPLQAVAPGSTHWYIQIAPRISPLGGFEVGTGMTIVSVAPEEAARALREAL